MKISIILLLIWTVTACTHTIYGVSSERWEAMNETERQKAIEQFELQEELLEKTRIQAESAKQEAEQLERQCREEPEKCKKIKRQRFGF